jgi:asparagine N-glycosylation enzyme membrane subunit Stt3
MSVRVAGVVLLGIGLLALGLRALGAPAVFVGDEIFLDIWDGAYHARRAFYSFVHFPEILFFDPLLRFPDGAPVPMPPLYDWLLAGAARLYGSDQRSFETVAAWASPTLAALTVLPVYAAGAVTGGRGVGLAAAALFACLPASTFQSGVGDPDHHAAVALLGATYLASSGVILGARGRRLAACGLTLTLVRAALALCWSGSLLYFALGEAALLLGAVFSGRRVLHAAQALGTLGAALLIAPFVAAAGTPLGGALSGTELSWLHCIALLSVASVAAGMLGLEHLAPTERLRPRVMRAVLLAMGVGVVLSIFTPLSEPLSQGVGFLGKSDTWAGRNAEQVPLFRWLGDAPEWSPDHALPTWGLFAYSIPLLPLVFLWRAFGRTRDAVRAPALLLFACWATALGALAVAQVRFGNDFAPVASVGFALLLAELRGALLGRLGPRLATACSAAVAVLLLAPTFWLAHLPALSELGRSLSAPPPRGDPALARGPTALVRFAQLVRRTTPETSGFLDANERPEYAVLVRPSHGHVMHYAARRATPINNFGPYLDGEKEALVLEFYGTRSEARGLEIAQQLGARYVVTFDSHMLRRGSLVHFLHRLDGSLPSGAHSRHFRLVAEMPLGTQVHWSDFPRGTPGPVIPYKLHERVAGAVLEVDATPGTRVSAELELQTNTGRRFRFHASKRSDSEGVARLRVPYDTEGEGPTRTLGPYRVEAGQHQRKVFVSDSAVQSGASIRLDMTAVVTDASSGRARGQRPPNR